MDLSKYQQLAGITVPTNKVTFVTAQINRCLSMLETMLGYTLAPNTQTNFYNELGKTLEECSCPIVATQDLQDPDAVVDAYRLFTYNTLDQYFHIDPFTKINKVKLVYIKQGETPNGITIKTFEDAEVRIDLGRDGFSKYIEHCRDCLCECECTTCIQLAVDAEWLWDDIDDVPDELLYVLVDMITYYSDQKRKIRSESITTHSYTKFDNTPPELEPTNLSVLKKYAGPNGSVTVQPTTGGQGRRY